MAQVEAEPIWREGVALDESAGLRRAFRVPWLPGVPRTVRGAGKACRRIGAGSRHQGHLGVGVDGVHMPELLFLDSLVACLHNAMSMASWMTGSTISSSSRLCGSGSGSGCGWSSHDCGLRVPHTYSSNSAPLTTSLRAGVIDWAFWVLIFRKFTSHSPLLANNRRTAVVLPYHAACHNGVTCLAP